MENTQEQAKKSKQVEAFAVLANEYAVLANSLAKKVGKAFAVLANEFAVIDNSLAVLARVQ